MQYTYSVIIPHRASLDLLKRALKSIPKRNDIQIIIADNTPYTVDFDSLKGDSKRDFTLLYSDIEKGAGHARNVGISQALGEWILFLDADDFYTPSAFDQFDKYISSDYDIIFFSSNSANANSIEKAQRHIQYNKYISDFVKGEKNAEDSLRYKFIPPWAKLIRHELLLRESIQFDEVPASNDLMFSIKCGHFANKILADNFVAYCISSTEGSLTQTINKKNSRSRYCTYIRQYQFMTAIGKPELRFNLFSTVIKSFHFGFTEFYWYINTAYREKVNIFLGVYRWPKLFLKRLNPVSRKKSLVPPPSSI